MGRSRNNKRGNARDDGDRDPGSDASADSDEESKQSGLQRFETHFETTLNQRIMGQDLVMEQSPESEHLGTTVWDSSIVVAKYFEKNATRTRAPFSRSKVKGKSILELGSGVGLAGMAAALLGPASVTMTDTAEMLPLMRRNIEKNFGNGRSNQQSSGLVASVLPTAAELDWCKPEQRGACGTFDLVIAADCVYHPTLAADLLSTLAEVTHKKSTVLIANEMRSPAVVNGFMKLVEKDYAVSPVPASDMDPQFHDAAIQLFLLRKRSGASSSSRTQANQEGGVELGNNTGPDGALSADLGELHLWEQLTRRGVEDGGHSDDDEGDDDEDEESRSSNRRHGPVPTDSGAPTHSRPANNAVDGADDNAAISASASAAASLSSSGAADGISGGQGHHHGRQQLGPAESSSSTGAEEAGPVDDGRRRSSAADDKDSSMWRSRRCGSLAARLLKNIVVPDVHHQSASASAASGRDSSSLSSLGR